MGVHLTQEQFNELLNRRDIPTPAPSSSHKNFTKSTLRFNGERSHAKVEEFVTGVSIYKQIEQIPDEDALTGLPLLLTDKASAWWTGVRADIKTSAAALASIRAAFAPKRQPHEIYVDFFSDTQGESEDIDTFVCRKRLLLGMLPSKRHKEDEQIDFVYGIMKLDLRKKIARSDIKSFSELLEKARNVEALEKQPTPSTSTSLDDKRLKRCSYCSKIGHSSTVCRKRLAKVSVRGKETGNESAAELPSGKTSEPKVESPIKCYGCGAPGVFRSQCTTCKNKDSPQKPVQFYAMNTQIQSAAKVPTIQIDFKGHVGNAYIDTAARTSIAGTKLYALMIKEGIQFAETKAQVDLADGSSSMMTLLTTQVLITMGGRMLPINFSVIPNAEDNRTLLGIDFLEQNSIVLHLAQRFWYFAEDPETKHEFIRLPNERTAEKKKKKTETLSEFMMWARNLSVLSPMPDSPETPVSPTVDTVRKPRSVQNLVDWDNVDSNSFMTPVMKTPPQAGTGKWVVHKLDTPPKPSHPREPRELDSVGQKDLRVDYVPINRIQIAKENTEIMQDSNRARSNMKRRVDPGYKIGDLVLVETHPISRQENNFSAKLAPRRDGPYTIMKKHASSIYEIAKVDEPDKPIGKYHTSAITKYEARDDQTPAPIIPIRQRGRPKKKTHPI
ncbi:Retrovirus-related Pol polyprotein from transposon 17.6 [Operophtera brumata]|uniref:Retrovirus-related Pol polyprotein from transposon 17.6 n=1 Tax=Operophtera brumata TaxID=104452 RepID=A0A0L7KY69_OPEBR|nr:Retrovirus-related Pol polyprotein from transposon 17.6 [Operophtera brumata]